MGDIVLNVRTLRVARAAIGLVVFLLIGQAAVARTPNDLDERVRQIAAELRCPVCQNLSVADSPSEMARQMRDLIRERLAAGESPEAVQAYFVEKYGEWILLAPKAWGFNLVVWVLPGAAALVGLGGLGWTLRRWLHASRPSAEAPGGDLAPYVARVREELSSFARAPGQKALVTDRVGREVPRVVPERATGPGPRLRRRVSILALSGLGVLGFGLLLGFLLVRSLEPRMEGMPITGGVGSGVVNPEMPGIPEKGSGARGDELRSELASAHAELEQQRYQSALAVYRELAARDPHNIEVLTHLALAQVGTGQVDEGLATFDRALAMDPTNAHALWSKALVLFELKLDYGGAITLWERFLSAAPASADAVTARTYIEQARRRLLGRAEPSPTPRRP